MTWHLLGFFISRPIRGLVLMTMVFAGTAGAGAQSFFSEHVVWQKNEDGMLTFHVPTIFVTGRGTVLAAADARYGNVGDFGPHHVVIKRSTDQGMTWSKNNYVGRSDHGQIYLFPNFIQARGSDRICFFYAEKDLADIHHVSHVWLRQSSDDGVSWSEPKDVVSLLVDHDAMLQEAIRTKKAGTEFSYDNFLLYGRRAFFTGPGVAIQLSAKNPFAPGRLVVPVLGMKDRWVSNIQRGQFNGTLVSDDGGITWKAGGTVPIGNFPNGEPNLIELADGSLLFNSRVEGENFRVISTSRDGGSTWSVSKRYEALPLYMQTGSGLARLSRADEDPTGTNRILFSFPNSLRRENMSVWLSYDEHRTWAVHKVINPGSSYYSNLAVLPDKTILLIYGRDGTDGWMPERTVVAHFNLEWLTDGRDSVAAGPQPR